MQEQHQKKWVNNAMTGQRTDNQTYRLHRSIVLVGMMGAGKSAIGKALSARLGVPFRDSDHEIEIAASRSIPEIFARDGEAFFRTREAEVIKRLLAQKPGILSTGGGAFLQSQNREAIAAQGVSVWLDAPLDLLWERVRHKDTRPLLRTDNPRKTLSDLFTARTPIYRTSQFRLGCVAGTSIEDTTTAVIALLKTDPSVLEHLS